MFEIMGAWCLKSWVFGGFGYDFGESSSSEGVDPVFIEVAGEAFVFFMSEGFFELHKVLIGFLEAGFVEFEVFVFASSFGCFAVFELGVFLLIIVIVVSFALFFKALTALL